MHPSEQIKSRLDVVTLIQSYIKLDKAGVNYKARCPFHSEKTPSFYVSPGRDIWHCFGCGKGGDIFRFIMEMEGLDFHEALRTLAERTGVEIRGGEYENRGVKKRLLLLLEETAKFFESSLVQEKAALDYLNERGLSSESIKNFGIGFAPDSWRATSDYLRSKGFSDEEMEKVGLTVRGPKSAYDRFRSRIIFPLEDSSGSVIGFGGRNFPLHGKENEGAKYINTPQTILYDKSRFLYGFSKAKEKIRLDRSALLVEGYFDCILSQQSGLKHTVAVSGTAMTAEHLKTLRRFADSLTLAFDVDTAGIEASRRAIAMAYKNDFNVKIVNIEGGKDPADIVLKDPQVWQSMVLDAQESVAFFLRKTIEANPPADSLSKKKIGDEILPLVAQLPSEIEKGHWLRELSKILKIAEEALWKELAKRQSSEAAPEVLMETPQPVTLTRKARLEERIAGLLLIESRLALLGDLPDKADCSLLVTGVLFDFLQKREFSGIKDGIFKDLPEDVRREAERCALEAEIFSPEAGKREEEFMQLLYSWKELSLKEKLSLIKDEIERLEVSGRGGDARPHIEKFNELTKNLAHIISLHYASEKKDKKEKY